VTEQELDAAQIGSHIEQMSGAGVPQHGQAERFRHAQSLAQIRKAMRAPLPPWADRRALLTRLGGIAGRHSFATILKSHGEDVQKVQELLSHANSNVTTNIYAQAVTDIKRKAQSEVGRLLLNPLERPTRTRSIRR